MRRKPLPRYEIWIGEEHKEHEILEIRAERLGEYVDRGERRSLLYRVYRKADGKILVHVYDRADVPGEIDRASLFWYEDLERAARDFRPTLQKMNLI